MLKVMVCELAGETVIPEMVKLYRSGDALISQGPCLSRGHFHFSFL